MKIVLFANTDWYLYNFRLPLARTLLDAGWEVLLLSPPGKFSHRLTAGGFAWQPIDLSPKGLHPLEELRTLVQLVALYRREKPDLVHHFTIKCVLYGSAAALWAHVPRVVNSITGLGYVFVSRKLAARVLRFGVMLLYRALLRRTMVIFQNPDDRRFFIDKKMVIPRDTRVILGSGVDTTFFTPLPEPAGEPLVVLPARLLWDKGVGEFVAAAQILKQAGVAARFVLVGASGSDNPAAITSEQVAEWAQAGWVEYWGFSDDIRSVLARSHVVCLPSYREGLPRILVEAAACGRAMVAADVPGCREVVRDGENGLLVPPRDPSALAAAIQSLIEDPNRRQRMAERSRQIAVERFSIDIVNRETIQCYQEMVETSKMTRRGKRA